MASLRELMQGKPSPSPPPVQSFAGVPQPVAQPAPARQLGAMRPGDELIPMSWPHDPATADGSQLTVVVDGGKESAWLGVALPDGRFIYLMGPLKIHMEIPF